MGPIDHLGDLGPARPQRDVGTRIRENLGKCRAPGAGGQHRRPANRDHGASARAAGSTASSPSSPLASLATSLPTSPDVPEPLVSARSVDTTSSPESTRSLDTTRSAVLLDRRPAELGAGGGVSPRIPPTIWRNTSMISSVIAYRFAAVGSAPFHLDRSISSPATTVTGAR